MITNQKLKQGQDSRLKVRDESLLRATAVAEKRASERQAGESGGQDGGFQTLLQGGGQEWWWEGGILVPRLPGRTRERPWDHRVKRPVGVARIQLLSVPGGVVPRGRAEGVGCLGAG